MIWTPLILKLNKIKARQAVCGVQTTSYVLGVKPYPETDADGGRALRSLGFLQLTQSSPCFPCCKEGAQAGAGGHLGVPGAG